MSAAVQDFYPTASIWRKVSEAKSQTNVSLDQDVFRPLPALSVDAGCSNQWYFVIKQRWA